MIPTDPQWRTGAADLTALPPRTLIAVSRPGVVEIAVKDNDGDRWWLTGAAQPVTSDYIANHRCAILGQAPAPDPRGGVPAPTRSHESTPPAVNPADTWHPCAEPDACPRPHWLAAGYRAAALVVVVLHEATPLAVRAPVQRAAGAS